MFLLCWNCPWFAFFSVLSCSVAGEATHCIFALSATGSWTSYGSTIASWKKSPAALKWSTLCLLSSGRCCDERSSHGGQRPKTTDWTERSLTRKSTMYSRQTNHPTVETGAGQQIKRMTQTHLALFDYLLWVFWPVCNHNKNLQHTYSNMFSVSVFLLSYKQCCDVFSILSCIWLVCWFHYTKNMHSFQWWLKKSVFREKIQFISDFSLD